MIFKIRAQNIECSFGCMARSAILLKPNVGNILLFNFCEQKFVQHGPTMIAIDRNGLSLLIFEEKWPNYASGPKSAPTSDSFWAFKCMRAVFLWSKRDNFACLHKRQDQKELHLKRWFFSMIFKVMSQYFPALLSIYTTIFVRRTLIICQIKHELSVTIHEISTSWKKKRLMAYPILWKPMCLYC